VESGGHEGGRGGSEGCSFARSLPHLKRKVEEKKKRSSIRSIDELFCSDEGKDKAKLAYFFLKPTYIRTHSALPLMPRIYEIRNVFEDRTNGGLLIL